MFAAGVALLRIYLWSRMQDSFVNNDYEKNRLFS